MVAAFDNNSNRSNNNKRSQWAFIVAHHDFPRYHTVNLSCLCAIEYIASLYFCARQIIHCPANLNKIMLSLFDRSIGVKWMHDFILVGVGNELGRNSGNASGNAFEGLKECDCDDHFIFHLVVFHLKINHQCNADAVKNAVLEKFKSRQSRQ
jgi:hypothetical protein